MKLKLTTLALSTSLALSAGSAQASALATAVLDITGFKLFNATTGLQLTSGVGGDLGFVLITDTGDISAKLGAVTSSASFSTPPDLTTNLAPVSVGAVLPAYAADSFAVYSSVLGSPASNFALADQIITGTPIDGGSARAGQGSYVSLLSGTTTGSSAANNGLDTSFAFALTSGGPMTMSFDARAYLEAFTSLSAIFPTKASASYSLSFIIDDLDSGGGNVVTWKPDGTSAMGVGITAELDPFNLNDAISRNSPFPLTGASFRGSSLGAAYDTTGTAAPDWSATTVSLTAGKLYQFTIRSTALADAQTVPEPETLALMGLGLMGLGLSRRRRRA